MARPYIGHDVAQGKLCTACHKFKSADNFRLRKYINGDLCLASECNQCRQELTFERSLWTKFRLTTGQYDQILQQQNQVCKICQRIETAIGRGGKVQRLAVDHDPKTGKVCGLLCTRCNNAIGALLHDFKIISAAAEYVRRTR